MINLFQKEETLVSLLIVVILFLSYFPLFYHLKTCPPGKVFSLSTGFPPDFLGNLTIVQEGFLGDFLRTSKVSSKIPSPPVFNKMDYILIGHLSRIFRIRPEIFFHFVRFFLSLLLLLTTYALLIRVFKKGWQRLASFILILFSTQIDLTGVTPVRHKLLINFWSPLQFTQRFSYYPHYSLAFLFLLWAVVFLARALGQKRPSFLIAAIFCGLLSSLAHPPPILLLYLCLPFYLLLKFFFRKKNQQALEWRWLFFCLSIFSLIPSLPLFYLKSISSVFPFNFLAQTEKQFPLLLSFTEIILGIGPTFFLSLLGIKKALESSNDLLLLILPAPLVLLLGFFFLAPLLGFANVRFLQTPFFIFLGILSVFGIETIKPGKKFLILACLFLIFLSTNALIFSLRESVGAFRDSPFFFIEKEVMDGIDWLEKSTGQEEIVFSSYQTGTLIAAYSGNQVFVTSFVSALPTLSEYDRAIKGFFKQNLSEKEAAGFLKKEKITYVFFGPEEKNLAGKENLSYPFLTPVFENKQLIIYQYPKV